MMHILVVVARFYDDIADMLTTGATVALKEAGHSYEVVEVPGAFEIPAAIRFALGAEKYDGYVALGAVIRGETSHYDYVCTESARGLQQLALEHEAAIGYGILTVENKAQAEARAALEQGNKGRVAAETCLRMVDLKKQFAGGSA